MTFYTSSITIDQVIDALADFIEPFVGDSEIVRAQVNRVPMPLGSVVVLTELLQVDLSIPFVDYEPNDDLATVSGPNRIDIQMDFYGESAGEFCKVVKSVFRTDYAFQNFPENIKPLYTNDGMQVPLITGEEQYESRWTLTVSMQYNPIVTVPQQFADEASVALFVEADSNLIS